MAEFRLCPCVKCGCGLNEQATIKLVHPTDFIEHLVQSNDAPSESEMLRFTSALSQGKKHLVDLESQIGRLTQTLESLKSKLSATRQSIQHYTTILNPIRRFPIEIIRCIFRLCVAESMVEHNASVKSMANLIGMLDIKSPPWTLSHVSTLWRDIALSYPQLWSYIALVLDSATERSAFALAALLQRSSIVPLSVSLVCSANPVLSQVVIRLLVSSSSRWQSLHVWTDWNRQSALLQDVRGFLPSLESLYLCGSIEQSTRIFERAPNLKQVTCTALASDHHRLPWHQITTFAHHSAYTSSPNEVLALFHRLPSIVSCSLRLHESSRLIVREYPVNLKDLRTLRLHAQDEFISYDPLKQALAFLIAPSLQFLEMEGSVDVADIISLVQRSNSAGIKLKLSNRLDEKAYERLTKACPTVEVV
ncbi:hypothetical protein C8J56DRAFT_1020682 [Mycena floridula]|nr:hypothetical protein C8J56DRAFT_1020682 [Mycena floridula]